MLKLKKLGAVAAAMALSLSLTTLPAAAADFTDVPPSFWGYTDIAKMSNLGLAGGYPDGTFKPNGKMTAAECLLFCTRTAGIDSATKSKIAQAHAEELKKIIPADMYGWAAHELALALETNVLSFSELSALASAGALGKTITRENICLYLVRALQLEPLAKSLTNYTLTFKDQEKISPTLKPYVYVLNNFGIVKGNDLNEVDPQGKVTRAEMTTMLSRAVTFMQTAGIAVELPEYTDYDWAGGTIAAVTPANDGSVILNLANPFKENQSFTLSPAVKVYKDNMLTNFTDLKPGQYARLNLLPSGTVREARLSGALTSVTGSITSMTQDRLTLQINGVTKNFEIDRFTQIMAGSKVGGREVIDPKAGYTSALCYVDAMGHLAAVKLAGGTRQVVGLVKSAAVADGMTTLGVASSDGVVYYYQIPIGTTVTINGIQSELSNRYVGKHVTLRVDTDSGKAVSVAVDTSSRYLQGPIQRLGTVGTSKNLYLRDVFSDTDYSYTIDSNASITFMDQPIDLSKLETGWYATIKVVNDIITEIEAFPGSVTVEGVLEVISYTDPTVLTVLDSDGVRTTYRLPLNDMPEITRNDERSSIVELRTGDKLVVTIRYNEVVKIKATPQTANLTGTIVSVAHDLSGARLELKLEDGTTKTFTVVDGITITQNGNNTNTYALKPGYTVGLVISGGNVISVDITATSSSSTQLTGTVFTVVTSGNETGMTVLPKDAQSGTAPVRVVTRGATILDLKGNNIGLYSLNVQDSVICYGSYDGAVFHATIVIVQK